MSGLASPLPRLRQAVRDCRPRPLTGRVERITGTMVEARLGGVRIGELCWLRDPGGTVLEAEVVGLQGARSLLTPLGDPAGLSTEAEVIPTGKRLSIPVSMASLGQVFDGLGRRLRPSVKEGQGAPPPEPPPKAEPLESITWLLAEGGHRDVSTVHRPPSARSQLAGSKGIALSGVPRGSAPSPSFTEMPLDGTPPGALARGAIAEPLPVNIRAIDALLTCAKGQRIGIFGPAGAGKSTLIAQIVRAVAADVVVVGLIGERGREVRDFLDRTLDAGNAARSVVVAATSDRPALERVKAAQTATAIAEWFRDQSLSVVLLIDSLTRLARAWREIGLAAGEPPTRRGFPPSVFAALPRLLERAGPGETGAITGFYTVLVEGDLDADPVADDVKAILDGHIVLSPALAAADQFPAIDVLASRSRLMSRVASEAHRAQAAHLRALLHRHGEIELLVRVGEYRAGGDPLADEALEKIGAIRGFLNQAETETVPFPDMLEQLAALTMSDPNTNPGHYASDYAPRPLGE